MLPTQVALISSRYAVAGVKVGPDLGEGPLDS
jgi:hypothetical protein